MVTYQEWTGIGFEVAKRKGLKSTGPGGQRSLSGGRQFTGDEPQAQLVRLLAEIWNDRKEELQAASVSRARTIAEDEITVR